MPRSPRAMSPGECPRRQETARLSALRSARSLALAVRPSTPASKRSGAPATVMSRGTRHGREPPSCSPVRKEPLVFTRPRWVPFGDLPWLTPGVDRVGCGASQRQASKSPQPFGSHDPARRRKGKRGWVVEWARLCRSTLSPAFGEPPAERDRRRLRDPRRPPTCEGSADAGRGDLPLFASGRLGSRSSSAPLW